MKTIRKKIFETNSSSTHSISLAYNECVRDEAMIDYSDINNPKIILKGGEFGWEIEIYNDALTKANYCALDFYNNEELTELLKETIEEFMEVPVEINIDFNNSYIDHQSDGTAREELCTKDDLLNFIFDPNSYLQTDNDNH